METEKLEKKCAACRWVFGICLAVSCGLIVGGFLVPPMGKIDGSILKAVGELFAFAALGVGAHALKLGYDLKIVRGDTTITMNDNKGE